jgi:hypothetical protein
VAGFLDHRACAAEVKGVGVFESVENDTRRKGIAANRVETWRQGTGIHDERTVALLGSEGAVEALADFGSESTNGIGISEYLVVDFQIGGDILRLDFGMRALGGAIFSFALGAAIPFLMKARYTLTGESESELFSSRTLEENVLHHSLNHLGWVSQHSHRDPEIAPDSFRLSDENIEDRLIDFVIATPNCDSTYFGLGLAKAINAPLALFETIWIPREIVVGRGNKVAEDERLKTITKQVADGRNRLVQFVVGFGRDDSLRLAREIGESAPLIVAQFYPRIVEQCAWRLIRHVLCEQLVQYLGTIDFVWFARVLGLVPL